MINQANAVVIATTKILGVRFIAGVDVRTYATPEDKKSVVIEVIGMFIRGETGFTDKASNAEKMGDTKKLQEYVVGLVNNHWRKHKKLNGGQKYEPKFKRSELQLNLPLAG